MLTKLQQQNLKERSLLPGQINLYKLLSFQSANFELSLHTMLVPDVLQTFYKGIVDFAIFHALIILTCIQSLSKKQNHKNTYSNILSEIDQRIINFTHKDALQPTRSCNFKDGISCFISDTSKTKKFSQNYRFIIWINRRLENETIIVSVDYGTQYVCSTCS